MARHLGGTSIWKSIKKKKNQEFIQKIILRTPRTLKTTKRNTADREDNIVMKKCLILFGEYRNNRENN